MTSYPIPVHQKVLLDQCSSLLTIRGGGGDNGINNERKNRGSTKITPSNPSSRILPPSQVPSTLLKEGKKKKKSNNNNNDEGDDHTSASPTPLLTSLLPSSSSFLVALSVRVLLSTTITLYILNQKHVLPKPLSGFVSKTLFWPTLPITLSRRVGKWVTPFSSTLENENDIDNEENTPDFILGGAPFGFLNYPEILLEKYNVKNVINMCEEYQGPIAKYKKLGINQLRLKTTDHFEPSVQDLKTAVRYIQRAESRNNDMNNIRNTLFSSFRSSSKTQKKKKKESVYIHCRAGHGRSAAVALAWLMYKNPMKTPKELNEYLSSKRNVRKYLWTQKNIIKFHSEELPSLLSGESGGDSDYEYIFDDSSSSYDGDDNDEESSIFSEDEDEKDYQLWKKYNG